ncbi:hypothetical protein BDZ89DRAFT_1138208 [Hymenopellis radicata]|nr:hypothetical protein BDZ89DRAFT_1138208 [Hymenopellis radicata]
MDSPLIFYLSAFTSLCVVAVSSCRLLRRRLLSVETGMNDLPFLGVKTDTKIPGTAVVCGGSIAGLLTARACHDHFERVLIVEPEAWLSTEEGRLVHSRNQTQARSRLIQYSSIQANLCFLYAGLSALFPNFGDACHESDISIAPGDYSVNFWGTFYKVPYAQYLGNLPKTFYASRKALETLIRRLALNPKSFPNIQQMVGTVVGVTTDPAKPGYLRQVSVRTQDGIFDIDAALVVDCTGPTQAGLKWLQRAGFGASLDSLTVSFDAKMHYSSCRMVVSPSLAKRLPVPGGFDNLGGSVIQLFPDMRKDGTYFGCLKDVGNEEIGTEIFLCCGGWGIQDLPRNLAGIRQYAASIHVTQPIPGWVWQFLDLLEEVEDTLTCSLVRVPASFWTHLESAPSLPANWIAIGDSVSRVNPLLSQGCPKALLGVLSMNTLLYKMDKTKAIPANFSRQFFNAQADKIKQLWESGKALDYGRSTTEPAPGETLEVGSFTRWFMRHLQLLALTDDQAGSTIWHSQMMINSTSIDALHPVLLGKVLWLAGKLWLKGE